MDTTMFLFFYELAEYANENWRGKFSPREVAEHAYIYTKEMEYSIEYDEISGAITDLADQLWQDVRNGSDEAKELLDKLQEFMEVM